MTAKLQKTLLFVLIVLMLTSVPGYWNTARTVSADNTTGTTTTGTTEQTTYTGWVQDDGNIYYYNSSGNMLVGKKKINGKVFFFSKKKSKRGIMQTGLVKIGKSEYYFAKKGALGTKGSGVNGWVNIKKRGYCYCVNGKIQKKACIDDYYLNSNGAMTSSSKKMYKLVKKTVKSLTNNSMTKLQKLRKCYEYLCSSSFTYVTKRPFSYASSWRITYGYEMLTTHSGVCYNFSAAFAYMARYIGYDSVKAVAGELLYLDGHWDLHSWTTITIDGTYYVFDASMEHGGMGDFWMKTYAGTGRKYREWYNL